MTPLEMRIFHEWVSSDMYELMPFHAYLAKVKGSSKMTQKRLFEELSATYAQKNKAYGNSAHDTYVLFGDVAYQIRIHDKLKRLNELIAHESIPRGDEPINDTIMDCILYCILFAADDKDAPLNVPSLLEGYGNEEYSYEGEPECPEVEVVDKEQALNLMVRLVKYYLWRQNA